MGAAWAPILFTVACDSGYIVCHRLDLFLRQRLVKRGHNTNPAGDGIGHLFQGWLEFIQVRADGTG